MWNEFLKCKCIKFSVEGMKFVIGYVSIDALYELSSCHMVVGNHLCCSIMFECTQCT